jgi:tol-pal system protein YbgF
MKNSAMLYASVLLLVTAGCATKGDLESVQRDNFDSQKRILRIERDLETVRRATTEEVQNTIKSFRKEMDSLRKDAAEIQASQDNIRVDMQELSGKIDEVKTVTKKSSDDKTFQKEELERRLSALEERLKKLEGPNSDNKSSEETPEGIYQNGINLFKSGDFQKSRESFEKLSERYPKHELAANAIYWTGETYYSEKKYEQAILSFQDLIKKYPKKDRVPMAMLKQALSFKAIGEGKNSEYILKKLVKDYPKSDEAKKAKALLKSM